MNHVTFGDRLVLLRCLLRFVFGWRTIALWFSTLPHLWGCPDPHCGVQYAGWGLVAQHRLRNLMSDREFVVFDKIREKLKEGSYALAFGDPNVAFAFINDWLAVRDEAKRRELRAKLGQDENVLIGANFDPAHCEVCGGVWPENGVRLVPKTWQCVDADECAERAAK